MYIKGTHIEKIKCYICVTLHIKNSLNLIILVLNIFKLICFIWYISISR